MIVNVLIGSPPMNQVIFFLILMWLCVCRSSLHRVSRFESCYQCGTRATWYQYSTSQSRWWRQWRGWIVFFYFFKHAHYIPHNISAFFWNISLLFPVFNIFLSLLLSPSLLISFFFSVYILYVHIKTHWNIFELVHLQSEKN